MSKQNKKWLAIPAAPERITYAVSTAAMLALALRGPEFSDDSVGYIEGSSLRTALYPLFLWLTNPTSAEALFSISVVVQLLLGAVAVATTAITLRRLLGLGPVASIFTLGCLMAPYFGFLHIGNSILSEGLAYPLFLLGFSYLLQALIRNCDRAFLKQLVLFTLASLARSQMAFVYPVSVLAALYMGWRTKSIRRALVLCTLCFASFLIASLIDRTYHLLRHDKFSGPSISGMVFVTPALYLSTEDDLNQLDEPAAALLRKVREECRNKGLLSDNNIFASGVTTYSAHYASAYNDIAWRTLFPVLKEEFGTGDDLSDKGWYQASDTLSAAAVSILKSHPRDFVRLYVSVILRRLSMTHAVVLACILALGIYVSIRMPNPMALTLTTIILLHLTNLAVTAIVQPIRLRYAFYTETLLVVILVLALAGALFSSRNGAALHAARR